MPARRSTSIDPTLWLYARRFGALTDRIVFHPQIEPEGYLHHRVSKIDRPPGARFELLDAGPLEHALEAFDGRTIVARTGSGHLALFGSSDLLERGLPATVIEYRPVDGHASAYAAYLAHAPSGRASVPGTAHLLLALGVTEGDEQSECTFEGRVAPGRWRSVHWARGSKIRDEVAKDPSGLLYPNLLLERCATLGLRPNHGDFYGQAFVVAARSAPRRSAEAWELLVGPHALAIYNDGQAVAEDDRFEHLAGLLNRLAADRALLIDLMLGRELGSMGLVALENTERELRPHRATGPSRPPTHRLLSEPSVLVSIEELIAAALRLRVRQA